MCEIQIHTCVQATVVSIKKSMRSLTIYTDSYKDFDSREAISNRLSVSLSVLFSEPPNCLSNLFISKIFAPRAKGRS